MAKSYAHETLKALAKDISVMNNVLQIAYENVISGMSEAEAGNIDLAHFKLSEVCSILEQTTLLFTNTLVKYRTANSKTSS